MQRLRGRCLANRGKRDLVRRLVSKAIAPEDEIIDVFSAAGLKRPDISEVRGLNTKASLSSCSKSSKATESASAPNETSSRAASSNRAIATQEIIEEPIRLAKRMSAANQRGVDLGRTTRRLRSTTRSPPTTAPSKPWAKTNSKSSRPNS